MKSTKRVLPTTEKVRAAKEQKGTTLLCALQQIGDGGNAPVKK
jgi:hypothetical protein